MLSARERSSGVEEGEYPSTRARCSLRHDPSRYLGLRVPPEERENRQLGGLTPLQCAVVSGWHDWDACGSFPASIVPSSADPAGVWLEAGSRCQEARAREG